MTMQIPKNDLTPDQKIWIEEILKSYLNNETPNEAKILLKCRGKKVSPDFDYRHIDGRMFYLKELNVFGIYCLNKNHKLLSSIDNIIKFINNNLNENNLPRSFTAEELEKALELPLQQIRVSFKLIWHYPLFIDSFINTSGFGYSSITIETYDTVQQYIRYKSVTSFIEDMLEYRKPFIENLSTPSSINYRNYSLPQSIVELMDIFSPVAETTLRRFIKSEENCTSQFIIQEKRGKYVYKSTQKERIKRLLRK